jgi:hypothetical protein
MCFRAESILVINLGNILLKSIPREAGLLGGAESVPADVGGDGEGDVGPAVLKIMYNRYELQLKNLEVRRREGKRGRI